MPWPPAEGLEADLAISASAVGDSLVLLGWIRRFFAMN